jgi:2-oxoglutarate dehydrogenase E2 component (dihydrolipoamide succinyltransferase)
MADIEIVIPKLGESVIEATITRWLKNEGDHVDEDDPIVEVATDKVDTEIPSSMSGTLVKKLAAEGEVVPVGKPFALIAGTGDTGKISTAPPPAIEPAEVSLLESSPEPDKTTHEEKEEHTSTRFYSPLVKSIARQENIPFRELDALKGTGKNDRITRQDLMKYLEERKNTPAVAHPALTPEGTGKLPDFTPPVTVTVTTGQDDRVIEMDRIRQLIAGHMVRSVQTSPHVTSFAEVDMTTVVRWREELKDAFQKKEGEKLTYTPVFIQAIARAVRDFPLMNVSVDGNRILVHRNINIGMAVALPNFNLIVPVIRNADQKNLLGLTKTVNDLANRARINKLVPDEISGGTISITNLGSFGTLMGTPIINQPQCAIVAVGAIKKRPVVIESAAGDSIAIRHMMILSVTFDHRVIDGALGGQFLSRMVENLESFNPAQAL